MAAPSQESQAYPPWLTPILTTVTDGAGIPIATSTTILYLPLTYYGPSIPLNSDWTYGGLTPPPSATTVPFPSTVTGTLSVPATLTSSTATPSESTLIPSSSAIPSESSSSTITPSSSLSFTSTQPTSIPTSSSTSVPVANHGLSRGQLVGIIVASILGLVFLFVFALSIYLCCRGRRRQTEPSSPLERGYMIVGKGRRPGEGSPRQSGEEADPFLQTSRSEKTGAGPSNQDHWRYSEMGIYVRPESSYVQRVPVPQAPPQESMGSNGSSSNSGYGELIDRPTLNLLPATQAELESQRRGHILSPEELRRMDEEADIPDPAQSPLLAPPRLVDPESALASDPERPFSRTRGSYQSQFSDADEKATVLTARRVKAENLASRTPPQLSLPLTEPSSSSSGAGFLAGLGQGLASIGRLSWLKNIESDSPRNSRPQSTVTTPWREEDAEVGRALLAVPPMTESQSSRGTSARGSDGTRPMSSASGGTVYHDALSSLPGTPTSSSRSRLALPPRAHTSAGQTSSASGTGEPPAYQPLEAVPPVPKSSSSPHLPGGFDILDTPVPTPVSPFASSTTFAVSLRETATTASTLALQYPMLPPGLGNARSKTWTDVPSGATHTNGPLREIPNLETTSAGISIDVLEEEPPSPGEGWRTLAGAVSLANAGERVGRRTTFGVLISPSEHTLEGDSIHSIRSHLSPTSSRSTGSAPSRRDLSSSLGSASSRPSAFSAPHTHSSGHSLTHSASVSSHARRRSTAASPTFSAFGGSFNQRGQDDAVHSTPLLSSPPAAHLTLDRERVTLLGSGGAEPAISRGSSPAPNSSLLSAEPSLSPPLSPLSQLSSAPWATGLDPDWTPA